MVDHLRPGQFSQHFRHIVGEGKVVAQNEDPYDTAPCSFISLLSTAIIQGSVGRNEAGTRDGPIRFCDERFKDRAVDVCGSRNWMVMTPYFKNCTVCLCLFSERILKTNLTTFDILFV